MHKLSDVRKHLLCFDSNQEGAGYKKRDLGGIFRSCFHACHADLYIYTWGPFRVYMTQHLAA